MAAAPSLVVSTWRLLARTNPPRITEMPVWADLMTASPLKINEGASLNMRIADPVGDCTKTGLAESVSTEPLSRKTA